MLESRFFGKTLTQPPTCPFCGLLVERPRLLTTHRPGEMPVGTCSCGAVYACDETGHNQGAALIEALVFGCDMDWDLAWNLLPDEDYTHKIVEQYDFITHQIVSGGFFDSRRISGVLFFVKLHADVEEVTAGAVRKRLATAGTAPETAGNAMDAGPKLRLSKQEVEALVREYRVDALVSAARRDPKLIPKLQRLLYSGDDLARKRAAEMLGRTCAVVGERDPAIVARLLQSLFYSITDTAAFTWGAFEAIGAIISRRPDLFAGYVAQLYQYLADDTRRSPALQAIGEVARFRPDLLRKYTLYFIPFFEDPDPAVRGYTAWLMGNLGAAEVRKDLEKLREESCEIQIYGDGTLRKKTVGQVAREALEKFS